MHDALLSLREVSVRLGERQLFERVSFQVDPRGLVVITGESGVGKSTLLRAIMGDVPFAGVVSVCGASVNGSSPRAPGTIVLVPQHAHLWEHLTVLDNLLLVRRTIHGERRHRAKSRCLALLDSLEVQQVAHRYPFRLSGGEQQRVSLARALAVDATIYLLDEPSTHLDHKRIQLVVTAIASLRRCGKAVVVATHDQALVAALDVPPFNLDSHGLTAS